ncbi:DUF4124 domain-containing protein [Aliikangiella marina]|uniref:DUF4124 domain-containing protein n=1 Tax=Aliikangiella marina TaxID=1712262 RepID=UPI00163D531C|nr:DUF4124 domain-containing protein [Aliikangiella marina]
MTVILTSFAHPVLAGEVYKWVDENGKVHYSDRPKDDNAQVVEIKNKVTPEQQAEARQQARKLIQLQQRRVAIEMENAQDKKRQEQENALKAEELKKTCQEAEKAVRILEFQAPVFEQNGKGGKRFISDEERKQELQKLKQGISQHCATDE